MYVFIYLFIYLFIFPLLYFSLLCFCFILFLCVVAGISPSNQLPVLNVDGKVLIESKVILSYVAKEISKYENKIDQAHAFVVNLSFRCVI